MTHSRNPPGKPILLSLPIRTTAITPLPTNAPNTPLTQFVAVIRPELLIIQNLINALLANQPFNKRFIQHHTTLSRIVKNRKIKRHRNSSLPFEP